MTFAETIALFGTMAVLAAIPSASVALVVARSITLGVPHGVAVGLGIVLGDLFFVGLVMLGLTVVAEAMGGMFLVVKCLGALYLLWLGLSLLRATDSGSLNVDRAESRGSFVASFFSGLILTLGDIKAIFFYLSLLPMFIDLTALRPTDALTVCVVTVVAVGGVKILYAVFANRVFAARKGHRVNKLTKQVAGTALIGAGGYLLVEN